MDTVPGINSASTRVTALNGIAAPPARDQSGCSTSWTKTAAKCRVIPDKPDTPDPGFSPWPKHLSERLWMFKDGQSYAALPVYIAILKHVVVNRTVYPSQATLGRMTKLSRMTIYRALCKLEKMGLIQSERKDKSHTLNHYHLTKTLHTPPKSM